MPIQEPKPAPIIYPRRPVRHGFRLFLFFSSAFLLTSVVSLLFADLLWRNGWTATCTILFALFVILFFLIALGCTHGIFGFVLRIRGDPNRITQTGDYRSRSIDGINTAIVIPTCNEEVARVMEGLRATYLSLAQTGQLERFDFFILSDSSEPDKWVEEERRWFELVTELDALGRIYYRRRSSNEGKKSGNVSDFLTAWGQRYRYFIVFDADSLMLGNTIVNLVQLMEEHPLVALIQTAPALVNAESLFGRIQQFANRLYAPIFLAGLNYWAQDFGNYWGHNAIIRTEPFMRHCGLPKLPGRKPFGGQILSHDFVEAALLLKGNWQVWFTYDLAGSYEEAPQDIISNAQRDRRWCQGNMQHSLVLCARGLRGLSRIHLLMGIFGYLASPLWLLFLLGFNGALCLKLHSGLSDIVVHPFTPFLNLNGPDHALLIFGICMTALFLPKILALIDLALNRRRGAAFGGLFRATASAVLETLFSALHAPLQMLWHSKFIAAILFGMGVNWGTQKRTANGIAWKDALRQHWGHTLIGLSWGLYLSWLDMRLFWWFSPVMAGMALAIPLSVWTSRSRLGGKARERGLFLVPEETSSIPELATLRVRMALLAKAQAAGLPPPDEIIAKVVLDPYLNAIHVFLLLEKQLNPASSTALVKPESGGTKVCELSERLLVQGPQALNSQEKMLVLSDADIMLQIHRQAWIRSGQALAEWWQNAIRDYAH